MTAHNLDLPSMARALGGDVQSGQVLCPGPGHSAEDRSLSVKPDKDDPDGFVVHSFCGDDWKVCRDHVRQQLGQPASAAKSNGNGGASAPWKILSEHVYRDEHGEPYLRVKKCLDENGKRQYPQSYWDGKQWISGKPSGPKIPYLLPQLIAAPVTTTVFCVEGEKDTDNLAKLAFVATTASEGAGAAWAAELTPYFKDRHVVILVDADTPGRKHGQKVAKAIKDVVASVKVLDLYPDRNDGSDVSNWLEDDLAGSRLAKLAKDEPDWEPSADADKADTNKADEALIFELAALPRLQYERRREQAAEQLDVRVSVLDKAVAEARGDEEKGKDDKTPGRWQVESWPEPVATDDLLSELCHVYTRHVILPEHGATAMALWVLHAWTIDASYCSPFLALSSPEPRCGKSTALSLLYWTGPRTALASNISPAAVFRYIEAAHPCLLIDEADAFAAQNDELRGILNSGHTRDTACVIRLVGDDHEPATFSTWAPKAIASIGKLAATLHDRSITLPMRRKRRGEKVEKLRGRDRDEFRVLREKAARWAQDNLESLKAAEPDIPESLNDRAADNWVPLLAIADLAGDDWLKLARAAALKLSGNADADAASIGTQLLAAIKAVFEALGTDRITSEGLAEELVKDKDSPWAAFKSGKPINQRQIATLLGRYGVHPDSIKLPDGKTKKGYLFAWLKDAFDTYLDVSLADHPFLSGTPEPAHSRSDNSNFSIRNRDDWFRSKNCEKPNNGGHGSGVPDRNTPPDGEYMVRGLDCQKHPFEPYDNCMSDDAGSSPNEADFQPGNGADIGQDGEDRSCRQCDGELDGTEQSYMVDGQATWLHPECQPIACATEGVHDGEAGAK
jgi:5S rRNA maturation endonuclease (ribonuclease M5)